MRTDKRAANTRANPNIPRILLKVFLLYFIFSRYLYTYNEDREELLRPSATLRYVLKAFPIDKMREKIVQD
jgi:hypothetical protein